MSLQNLDLKYPVLGLRLRLSLNVSFILFDLHWSIINIFTTQEKIIIRNQESISNYSLLPFHQINNKKKKKKTNKIYLSSFKLIICIYTYEDIPLRRCLELWSTWARAVVWEGAGCATHYNNDTTCLGRCARAGVMRRGSGNVCHVFAGLRIVALQEYYIPITHHHTRSDIHRIYIPPYYITFWG